MIRRIVKMTFQEERVEEFLQLFNTYKQAIRHQPGCQHLELWQDEDHPHIFYTYSLWDSVADLNAYRHSETFAKVWPATKAFFSAKPSAFSAQQKIVVEDEKK